MTNKKLFNDIFLEAQAAKILAAEILEGDVPLKKISKSIDKHMANIMESCTLRETDNG